MLAGRKWCYNPDPAILNSGAVFSILILYIFRFGGGIRSNEVGYLMPSKTVAQLVPKRAELHSAEKQQ